jgi:hypothetical protein
MHTLYYVSPDQFCPHQKETGGEYGVGLVLYCMADHCPWPGKQCLYVEKGGKRPQDGE